MKNLKSLGAKISTTSHYVPKEVTTNQNIIDDYQLRLKDQWVKDNIGIEQRHWCKNGEAASDIGAKALEKIVSSPTNLDCLIVSTVSEDVMTPATACIIQSKVSPGETYPAFDIKAACGGFVFAIDLGVRMIATGYKKVACVATETRSYYLNKKDRRTVMLFGDGAAAALIEPTKNEEVGIFYSKTLSDGRFWNSIIVPGSGSQLLSSQNDLEARDFIQMNDASGILKSAIEKMSELINTALQENDLKTKDIAHFIFHQASKHIVEKAAESLNLKTSQYSINFNKYGNMTSASVGVLLDECIKEKKIQKGDLVCMIATGGGFSAGITLFRWED